MSFTKWVLLFSFIFCHYIVKNYASSTILPQCGGCQAFQEKASNISSEFTSNTLINETDCTQTLICTKLSDSNSFIGIRAAYGKWSGGISAVQKDAGSNFTSVNMTMNCANGKWYYRDESTNITYEFFEDNIFYCRVTFYQKAVPVSQYQSTQNMNLSESYTGGTIKSASENFEAISQPCTCRGLQPGNVIFNSTGIIESISKINQTGCSQTLACIKFSISASLISIKAGWGRQINGAQGVLEEVNIRSNQVRVNMNMNCKSGKWYYTGENILKNATFEFDDNLFSCGVEYRTTTENPVTFLPAKKAVTDSTEAVDPTLLSAITTTTTAVADTTTAAVSGIITTTAAIADAASTSVFTTTTVAGADTSPLSMITTTTTTIPLDTTPTSVTDIFPQPLSTTSTVIPDTALPSMTTTTTVIALDTTTVISNTAPPLVITTTTTAVPDATPPFPTLPANDTTVIQADISATTLNPVQSTNKPNECKPPGMDLIFVIDSSGSIDAADFQRALTFMISIITDSRKDENNRIGIVRFSTDAVLFLDLTNNFDEATRVASTMPQDRGGTNIYSGLNMANQMFTKDKRNEVPSVVLLVTDGQSGPPDPALAANDLKSSGVNLFGIGIGPHATTNLTYWDDLDQGQIRYYEMPLDTEKGITFNINTTEGNATIYGSLRSRSPSQDDYDFVVHVSPENPGKVYLSPEELQAIITNRSIPISDIVTLGKANATIFTSIIGSSEKTNFTFHYEPEDTTEDEAPKSPFNDSVDDKHPKFYQIHANIAKGFSIKITVTEGFAMIFVSLTSKQPSANNNDYFASVNSKSPGIIYIPPEILQTVKTLTTDNGSNEVTIYISIVSLTDISTNFTLSYESIDSAAVSAVGYYRSEVSAYIQYSH